MAVLISASDVFRASGQANPVQAAPPEALVRRTPANPALPSIFIVGDSTADFHPDRDHEGAAAIQGWGTFFPIFFDPSRMNVVNAARGGRSSRTFMTEGLWEKTLAEVKPGDIVLIQLGQNDVFEINDQIARGTLPGIGEESQEIENSATHRHETVHTFGWYLRKYVKDTQDKGATAVVMSLTARNVWKDGRVEVGVSGYREWSRSVALNSHADFVDVSAIMAREYEKLGQAKVAGLYHTREPVHMTTPGAYLAAQCVLSGLKALLDRPANRYLSMLGEQVAPAEEMAFHWPANPKLPTLWVLGDSTVRNGDGTGANGLWGWGDQITPYLAAGKRNVSNIGVSGISSRTYYALHWPLVLPFIKKGDVLLIQLGHNDDGDPADKSRARASLPGIGEETRDILNPITGDREDVHTYGWYLRRILQEAKQKGAMPILCTPVPRNIWIDGKIKRDSHVDWIRATGKSEEVPVVELNEIIAAEYDRMGSAKVDPLFADKTTHQTLEGARLNAKSVVLGLKKLPIDPLANDVVP